MIKNLAIKGGGVKGSNFNLSLTGMDNLIESGRKATVKYINQKYPAVSNQPMQLR